MNSLRTIFAHIVLVALAIGYALSQRAFFDGTTSAYSKQIDQPQISVIALAVIVLCVVSAAVFNADDRSDG